jgi:hypothetical protein
MSDSAPETPKPTVESPKSDTSPASEDGTADGKSVGDRFPSLKPLEELTERAKLEKARAEAQAGALKAKLPSLDLKVTEGSVTQSDKTTGLARVLVQMDSELVADHIAIRALDGACGATSSQGTERKYAFRVISDLGVLASLDAATLMKRQAQDLRSRIDEYVPAPTTPGQQRPLVDPATLSAIVGLGVQAAGSVINLLATDHTLSGREVPVEDLGLDLSVARCLIEQKHARESVEVAIDRTLPAAKPDGIVADVLQVASDGEKKVNPKVADAGAKVAIKSAEIAGDDAEIAAIDAQILKLVEHLPATEAQTTTKKQPATKSQPSEVENELAGVRKRRAELTNALAKKRRDLSSAQIDYERGSTLLSDIETFTAAALTAPDGSRPPLFKAARAEGLLAALQGQEPFILYARLLAAGLDQDVEDRKVRSDHLIAVAGVSAEWALLDKEGRLIAGNALSILQSSKWELGEPESLAQHRVGSMGISRECVPGNSKVEQT